MRKLLIVFLSSGLMLAAALTGVFAGQDEILKALREELTRSMARLRLPGHSDPYYISYRLTQTDGYYLNAALGAIIDEHGAPDRKLYVEIRVGDYQFDNSSSRSELDNFDPDIDTSDYMRFIDAPLDDDPDALRARLWRVSDSRYKNALAAYLNKKARSIYREAQDKDLADFTREQPVKFRQSNSPFKIDKPHWQVMARKASLLFKNYPEILESEVDLQIQRQTQYLMNTEGTDILTEGFFFAVSAQASALATDGMRVQHVYSYYTRSLEGLPTEKEILDGITQMAQELVALRQAPVLGPYTGPAILDPTVAGIFFHEAIGHRLEGDRTRNTDEGQTFKGKLGKDILPNFIDVYDDPTVVRYGSSYLNGYYAFDEEGVPSRRADLVREGKLVGFLLSRKPIEHFSQSNGHGRASAARAPMSRMGSLFIVTRQTVTAAKMKEMLLEQARAQGKPYGLRLTHGMAGETATDQFNFQAFANRPTLLYRVDAQTGKEELVRGVELVGTPLLSINKVLAAGDDSGVFNGYCGAESGFIPVSSVAPSLLVSEIELQRVRDKPTKPPILPAPYLEMPGKK